MAKIKFVIIEEGEFDEERNGYGYSYLDLYTVNKKDLQLFAKKIGYKDYTRLIDKYDNDAIADLSDNIHYLKAKKTKIKVKFDIEEDAEIVNPRKGVLYLYPAL